MKMRTKGKRILSLALVLMVLLTLLPSGVLPVYSKEVETHPDIDKIAKLKESSFILAYWDLSNMGDAKVVGSDNFPELVTITGVKVVGSTTYYQLSAALNKDWPASGIAAGLKDGFWLESAKVLIVEPCDKCGKIECGSSHENWCDICKVDDCPNDHLRATVTDSEGKEQTIFVAGDLPDGAQLAVSIPEIGGEKLPNVFDIKVLAPNENGEMVEWQPIDYGKTVTLTFPVNTNAKYVDVVHALDYATAINDSVIYVPIQTISSDLLSIFESAIDASNCEGFVAVEKYEKINNNSGFVAIETNSFSIYEWKDSYFDQVSEGSQQEVTINNISGVGNKFSYYASPNQKFKLSTAWPPQNSDPYSLNKESTTVYFENETDIVSNVKESGLIIWSRSANIVIPETAMPGQQIVVNFVGGGGATGTITITVVAEVTVSFASPSVSVMNLPTSQKVVTDGDETKNIFSLTPVGTYVPTPTDSHYEFKGWNTAPDGTGTSYNYNKANNTFSPASFTPMRDMTLYALWKSENSIVKFNANRGTGTYEDVTVNTGDTITLPEGPQRTNYVFLGWSASPDGYSTPYAAGDNYAVNQDTTLYAIWGVDLTINVSGETELLLQKEGDFEAKPLQEHTYTNGQPVFIYDPVTVNGVTTYRTVLLEGFLKNARFTFKYSSTYKTNEPASTGAQVKFTKQTNQVLADIAEAGINVNTTISFSAVPQGQKSFIVSYNTNYSTPVASTVLKGLENETLTLNALPTKEDTTRTGYTLEGWYLDEAFTQKATIPMSVTANITLYAKWTPNSYTAKWVVDGTVVEEKTYNYGAQLAKPSNPVKTGYSFDGWSGYTDGMAMPAGDVTFTARWEIKSYTVTIMDGDTVIDRGVYNFGAAIERPTDISKVGYYFDGWDGYTEGMTMPDEDVTFTAKWVKINYSIEFLESNGTQVEGVETITFDIENVTELQLPTPEKGGSNFLGWYTTRDLTGKPCDLETLSQLLLNQNDSKEVSVKLYAKWEASVTSMTIKVEGCNTTLDPNQSFLFTVEGPDGVKLKVTVLENGSVTIHGVTIGQTYTVTMDNAWSWRYSIKNGTDIQGNDNVTSAAVAGNCVTFTLGQNGMLTFKVTRNTDKWLDGNAYYKQ